MDQDAIIYRGLVFGGRYHFLNSVGIVVAESVDAHFQVASEDDLIPGFAQWPKNEAAPLGMLGVTEGILGLCVIVSPFILDRVVETIWDEGVWPKIKSAWQNFRGPSSDTKRYGVGISIGVKERRVTLVIIAVGANLADVEAQQRHFNHVARVFREQMDKHHEGLVYRYTIENGKVSGPEVFVDSPSAISGFGDLVAAKHPILISPES